MFPDAYPFTESIVKINLSLGLINLIPAYPLDGGRIAESVFYLLFGEKKGKIITETTGFLFTAVLTALFILSCFK